MQKPELWNCFKAGVAYTVVSWLLGMVLGFIGIGGWVAITSGELGSVQALGLLALLIAIPLIFLTSGYIQYHVVRWAFGK